CVAFYPATDVKNVAKALMPPGSDEAAIRDASPLTHIREGFPPTVIFHGLSDVTMPPPTSQHRLQALRAVNVPSELHTFAAAPHGRHAFAERRPVFVADRVLPESCAAVRDLFLEGEIVHPRTYPPFSPGPGRGAA